MKNLTLIFSLSLLPFLTNCSRADKIATYSIADPQQQIDHTQRRLDCPSLGEPLQESAFDALDHADLVFGPAADGGYYLVGLSRPGPRIFSNIGWGGPQVLDQSLAAARESGFRLSLPELLSDVDLPGDLPDANAALTAGTSLPVIIHTLSEELQLPISPCRHPTPAGLISRW